MLVVDIQRWIYKKWAPYHQYGCLGIQQPKYGGFVYRRKFIFTGEGFFTDQTVRPNSLSEKTRDRAWAGKRIPGNH